jgi:hypothetical protein
VAHATIAVDFDQTLDISAYLLAKLTLDRKVLVDELADAANFVVGEVSHLGFDRYVDLAADALGRRSAYAEDVAKRHLNALVAGDVYS